MSSEGAVSYFDNALHRTDYYAKEVGLWGGKGAELLGLHGEVDRKAFAALAQNKKPGTGERLTARTNTTRKEKGTEESVANRRARSDFTFSVPKSVSLYLAFNEDRRVEQMIAEALGEAMREVESRMETKVRKGYRQENRLSANMVYAKFVHRETRPVDGIPDPHCHLHVFVFNATWDSVEQQWKALEVGDIVGDRPYYEAIFHARLADRLIAAGYGIRRTDRDFELVGVTRELIEKFSKRTQLIEQIAREKYTVLEAKARALMKQSGMAFEDAFAQVKSELGLLSREKKSTAKLSHEEQLENWRAQITPEELESLRPEDVRGRGSRNLIEREAAEELSVSHLFERRSLARTLHAAAMLLRRGIGKVSVKDALEFGKSSRFVNHRARGGFKVGQQWEVVGIEKDAVRVDSYRRQIKTRAGGSCKQRRASWLVGSAFRSGKSFQIFESRTVELAIDDQVRATKNIGVCKNNQLYRVVEISDGHIGLASCSGGEKWLSVSTDRGLHLDQGIAVTSHASQGKTVDQVIASVPVSSFAQVNQAQFYVSMSRARGSMHFFTDCKDALREAVCRTAERLSPSEIEKAAEKGLKKERRIIVANEEVDLQLGARRRTAAQFQEQARDRESDMGISR